MNIRITSRKFKAKDSLKDLIKGEVKSFERFNDQIMDCNVVLSFTHNKDSIKTAEIITKLPGHTITVSVSSDEFEKSIMMAVDKIVKQLVKVKTKKIVRKKAEPKVVVDED
ncbi:MAG: ribosome-associated translation inhibitor RaiA [Ignavibacteria bacterium]|nr:ribosome-associated translation inhibitor RaiA [Ignavibacteria bacterium]